MNSWSAKCKLKVEDLTSHISSVGKRRWCRTKRVKGQILDTLENCIKEVIETVTEKRCNVVLWVLSDQDSNLFTAQHLLEAWNKNRNILQESHLSLDVAHALGLSKYLQQNPTDAKHNEKSTVELRRKVGNKKRKKTITEGTNISLTYVQEDSPAKRRRGRSKSAAPLKETSDKVSRDEPSSSSDLLKAKSNVVAELSSALSIEELPRADMCSVVEEDDGESLRENVPDALGNVIESDASEDSSQGDIGGALVTPNGCELPRDGPCVVAPRLPCYGASRARSRSAEKMLAESKENGENNVKRSRLKANAFGVKGSGNRKRRLSQFVQYRPYKARKCVPFSCVLCEELLEHKESLCKHYRDFHDKDHDGEGKGQVVQCSKCDFVVPVASYQKWGFLALVTSLLSHVTGSHHARLEEMAIAREIITYSCEEPKNGEPSVRCGLTAFTEADYKGHLAEGHRVCNADSLELSTRQMRRERVPPKSTHRALKDEDLINRYSDSLNREFVFKEFRCFLCNASEEFASQLQLLHHIDMAHYKRIKGTKFKVECPFCSKHFYLSNPHRPLNVEECESIDSRAMRYSASLVKKRLPIYLDHLIQSHGVRIPDYVDLFRCPVGECVYECAWKTHMIWHIKSHDETQYRKDCPRCGKAFADYNLDSHVKNCSQRTRVPCPVCKKLMFSASLKEHIRKRHEGEKSEGFLCTHCTYHCMTRPLFNHHMYQEHGALPDGASLLNCEKCDYKTPSRKILNRHFGTMHDSPVVCEVCGKVCKNQELCRRHKADCHTDNLHKCRLCDYTNKRLALVKAHTKAKHLKISLTCECGYTTRYNGNFYNHRNKGCPLSKAAGSTADDPGQKSTKKPKGGVGRRRGPPNGSRKTGSGMAGVFRSGGDDADELLVKGIAESQCDLAVDAAAVSGPRAGEDHGRASGVVSLPSNEGHAVDSNDHSSVIALLQHHPDPQQHHYLHHHYHHQQLQQHHPQHQHQQQLPLQRPESTMAENLRPTSGLYGAIQEQSSMASTAFNTLQQHLRLPRPIPPATARTAAMVTVSSTGGTSVPCFLQAPAAAQYAMTSLTEPQRDYQIYPSSISGPQRLHNIEAQSPVFQTPTSLPNRTHLDISGQFVTKSLSTEPRKALAHTTERSKTLPPSIETSETLPHGTDTSNTMPHTTLHNSVLSHTTLHRTIEPNNTALSLALPQTTLSHTALPHIAVPNSPSDTV